jgi:hypothetical protein
MREIPTGILPGNLIQCVCDGLRYRLPRPGFARRSSILSFENASSLGDTSGQ